MFKNFIIIITLLSSFSNLFGADNSRDKNLILHLKPLYDSSGKAKRIHVSYEVVFNDDLKSHSLNLHFDLKENHEKKIDQIYDLIVKDEDGAVEVNIPKKDFTSNVMMYTATRKVNGKVTVEYTIAVASTNTKGVANIDMQACAGGVTGSLINILLLPPFDNKLFVKLDWNLDNGSTAVSSFGVGDVTSLVKISYRSLQYVQFIVGHLTKYPSPLPDKDLNVAGLGLGEESMGNSLSKFKDVYEYLKTQFQGSSNQSFHYFYPWYPELQSSSGSAVQGDGYGSFLICIPPVEKLHDNKGMFCLVGHEMLNVFISGLNEEWYNEDSTEYLSIVVPYNGDLYSNDFYLKSINQKESQYFTNDLGLLSCSVGHELKFSSAKSCTLAYPGGFLYFAKLDSKLKKLKKGSKTTVLSLVMEMGKLGKPQEDTEKTWVELIRKEVGEWEVKDLQDMKDGKLIIQCPVYLEIIWFQKE